MSAIAELGCIVCLDLGHKTPAALHHIEGRTKPDAHLSTIPLCARHHQIPGEGYVSRHGDGKARFEAEYGTELELLEKTRGWIGWAT